MGSPEPVQTPLQLAHDAAYSRAIAVFLLDRFSFAEENDFFGAERLGLPGEHIARLQLV